MRFFYLKLSAFLSAVAVAILCLIFLFCNHNDRLIQFVPAEAEAYFHAETRDLLKLPQNQWQTYTAWLAEKSAISAGRWESIFRGLNNEIGIFSINGQVFGVTKNNYRTLGLIARQEMPFTVEKDIIYFPALNISANKLTGAPWFRATRRKIVFSDYVLYLKKLNGNTFPFPSLGTEQPIAAFGNVNDGVLKLKVRGDVGQSIRTKQKPQLTQLPENFNFYFRNINTGTMTQKAEYTTENFRFNLLKLIKGPVEYLDTTAGFTLFANTTDNPLEELKSNLANLLALTEPTRKEKALPDGTVAIQRVVDPSAWQFKETLEDGQSVWELTNVNQENSLSILQRGKMYSIKHYPKASNPEWTISTDIFDKCNKFRNESSALLNLKQLSKQTSLNNLYLINQSASKLVVCID